MTGILRGAILAIAMSLFHLYVGMFGVLEALMLRLIHVAFGLSLLFLIDLDRRRDAATTNGRAVILKRAGALVCLAWMFAALDPISGSVPHRSYLCAVRKLPPAEAA